MEKADLSRLLAKYRAGNADEQEIALIEDYLSRSRHNLDNEERYLPNNKESFNSHIQPALIKEPLWKNIVYAVRKWFARNF